MIHACQRFMHAKNAKQTCTRARDYVGISYMHVMLFVGWLTQKKTCKSSGLS